MRFIKSKFKRLFAEELSKAQQELDLDGDGEIEGSDLSGLRSGEKKGAPKKVKEELGDPEGEAASDRKRQAGLEKATQLKKPSSNEEVEMIADLMANDPEFQMFRKFVDKFKKYAQSGGAAISSLEAALPEYMPGALIYQLAAKAKEAMTGGETPIPQPESPAASAADMERWEGDYKNEGMKHMYKQNLKRIIREELAREAKVAAIRDGFMDKIKRKD